MIYKEQRYSDSSFDYNHGPYLQESVHWPKLPNVQ